MNLSQSPAPVTPPNEMASALDSPKTKYTEQWEKEEMEKLYQRFAALIGPLDMPLIGVMTKKINEHFKDKKEISMLEIGAGAGRATELIFDSIANDRRILYDGIDVSPAQRKAFEENKGLPRAGAVLKNYELSPWQDYQVTHPYDLVLAQHSWYGIGGDKKYIEKLVSSINEGGMAFVMLSGAETISLYAWKSMGEKGFSAEDFEKSLQEAGVEYEKIKEESDTYKREDFYKDGKLTQKGIDLCGYLYKREVREDDAEVIEMIKSAPEESFKYPKFLFVIKK